MDAHHGAAVLGDVLIVVHAPINPDPGEWRALMEASRANAHRYGRCLVFAGSVTLTAGQSVPAIE